MSEVDPGLRQVPRGNKAVDILTPRNLEAFKTAIAPFYKLSEDTYNHSKDLFNGYLSSANLLRVETKLWSSEGFLVRPNGPLLYRDMIHAGNHPDIIKAEKEYDGVHPPNTFVAEGITLITTTDPATGETTTIAEAQTVAKKIIGEASSYSFQIFFLEDPRNTEIGFNSYPDFLFSRLPEIKCDAPVRVDPELLLPEAHTIESLKTL